MCSHRLQQKHLHNCDCHSIIKSKEVNLSTLLTWKRQNVWCRLFSQPFLFKHIFLNLLGTPSLAVTAVLFLLTTVGKTYQLICPFSWLYCLPYYNYEALNICWLSQCKDGATDLTKHVGSVAFHRVLLHFALRFFGFLCNLSATKKWCEHSFMLKLCAKLKVYTACLKVELKCFLTRRE